MQRLLRTLVSQLCERGVNTFQPGTPPQDAFGWFAKVRRLTLLLPRIASQVWSMGFNIFERIWSSFTSSRTRGGHFKKRQCQSVEKTRAPVARSVRRCVVREYETCFAVLSVRSMGNEEHQDDP
ncbi:uncharacterized protein CIMG_11728 [Coccidioides immitis RS]|uniref:Uncharacterized protein n=1 Tax=Coccidioides immitis (strain RS) TaxID=246410 RepID=A0A0D8JTS7_COCIM|nr:uncharacterized protein CIMG_11728 [Coccidioides immitis RS]KJF60549.1 hypothetical protein CIMG_11728 [Coccidioides immitis RS]